MSAMPELGNLPEWDLDDLYPGRESEELHKDLEGSASGARDFQSRYKGRVAKLGGAELGQAIAEYENLDETLSRIMSYAQLVYALNVADPEGGRFYQTMQEKVNDISAHLLFFTLEINAIGDSELKRNLSVPEAAKYASWLRNIRLFRPHQLDEELERLLHEKHVTGRASWNRLFDETMSSLKFCLDGKELSCEEILDLLSDPAAEVRKAAALEFGKVLKENSRLFSLITNTLAKDKEIEDKWRRFPAPQSSRNLSNQVEDEVVDALASAVKAACPDLSHRYYRLKARWMGKDRLDYWDRNAPLPEAADRRIAWTDAQRIVLAAYGKFSPELEALGRRFFDHPWIDAGVRPGKSPGAFAHPTVPSAHPYLLLNYLGKPRDVMTLAHELGHGVHQLLAAPQGQLLANTPLTLAETASVFGEMLTFRGLLAAEEDPSQRKILIASKVEDMLNTVVRQVAFYSFELKVHRARRGGELAVADICDMWMETQSESLGPAIELAGDYRYFWAYIPHFIHSPFYVYAYAFGDCLVNSLYAVYQEAEEDFATRYFDMLRAGGSLRHKELLAPFGLDAGKPDFWARGLGVISGLIDELETLG